MKIPQWAIDLSDAGLCAFQKWWRPLGCMAVVCGLWANMVIVPLVSKTYPDLAAASTLCATFAAIAGIREWAKIKGTAD